MTEQTQMFPLSKVETAELFLEHFQADVESAEKSLGNARARMRAALDLRDAAEANLLRARTEQDMEIPGEATEEGEVTDPITGEPVSDAREVCPACDGDGRIPDKTGGGHHGTCPQCAGSGAARMQESAA